MSLTPVPSVAQLIHPLSHSELVQILVDVACEFPGVGDSIRERVHQRRRKLFVRNLEPTTTSETVRQSFEQFGSLAEAVVMFDQVTRRSRQYAFVTFHDADVAERILNLTNLVIDGRVVEISLALTREANMRRLEQTVDQHPRLPPYSYRGGPPPPPPMGGGYARVPLGGPPGGGGWGGPAPSSAHSPYHPQGGFHDRDMMHGRHGHYPSGGMGPSRGGGYGHDIGGYGMDSGLGGAGGAGGGARQPGMPSWSGASPAPMPGDYGMGQPDYHSLSSTPPPTSQGDLANRDLLSTLLNSGLAIPPAAAGNVSSGSDSGPNSGVSTPSAASLLQNMQALNQLFPQVGGAPAGSNLTPQQLLLLQQQQQLYGALAASAGLGGVGAAAGPAGANTADLTAALAALRLQQTMPSQQPGSGNAQGNTAALNALASLSFPLQQQLQQLQQPLSAGSSSSSSSTSSSSVFSFPQNLGSFSPSQTSSVSPSALSTLSPSSTESLSHSGAGANIQLSSAGPSSTTDNAKDSQQ